MKKSFIISLIVLIFLLILTSCVSNISSNGSNVPTESKPPEGKIFLKADITKVLSGSSNYSYSINSVNSVSNSINSSSETDIGKWHVIYENVTMGDGIRYETIDSTEVKLELEKGNIYVVGLAKKNDSGWIEMVGVLGEPYLGVTCIPVSEEATEIIDLGSLIEDEGILKSETVTPEEFSEMVGFSQEMLQEFGKSDVTFKNFLNPDININGVIDSYEGLSWGITTIYDFRIDKSNENPIFEVFTYLFWMDREYVLNTYKEDFAVNAINNDILNNDKDIATLTNLDIGKSLEPHFVHLDLEVASWYFQDEFPENGDYKLDALGSDTRDTHSFYFEDLRFFNPLEDFEGLITPIFETTIYSDGKVKNLSWDWKIFSSGVLVDVSEDIVRLLSNKTGYFMWFYFSTKSEFFNGETGPSVFKLFIPEEVVSNPYIDQTVNLESMDYWVIPNPWESVFNNGNYLMIGDTQLGFNERCNYLEKPHDFDPNDEGTPLTLDNLDNIDGTWYNLYYHNQNWERDDLILNNGDKWASIKFNSDTGEFEASWLFDFKRTDFDPEVAMTGTFEISQENPHVIVLKPSVGDPLYMYVEIHDTYIEAMISDTIPTEIIRESENYVIYSRYSQ